MYRKNYTPVLYQEIIIMKAKKKNTKENKKRKTANVH